VPFVEKTADHGWLNVIFLNNFSINFVMALESASKKQKQIKSFLEYVLVG
jgi:hypothetical protein